MSLNDLRIVCELIGKLNSKTKKLDLDVFNIMEECEVEEFNGKNSNPKRLLSDIKFSDSVEDIRKVINEIEKLFESYNL